MTSARLESVKSSKFLSFICPNWAYLRYDRLANFDGVEFSDSPKTGKCSGRLMNLHLASWNGLRLRNDTKAIQLIGTVQLIEFMVESANFEQELA